MAAEWGARPPLHGSDRKPAREATSYWRSTGHRARTWRSGGPPRSGHGLFRGPAYCRRSVEPQPVYPGGESMTRNVTPRSMRNMSVAVLAPSFPPAYRGGGPARTLDALASAAAPICEVRVFAPDKDTGVRTRLSVRSNSWSPRGSVQTYFASVDRPRGLAKMYLEVRRLRADVVYLNSLFNLKFSIFPRLLVASRFWRPAALLIAPRGELDPGALRIRYRKKRAFLLLYRLLGLSRGVLWHASSEFEAHAIRAVWGEQTLVLVREDETLLPPVAALPTIHHGPLRAVFISRISPKKGLLTALLALKEVSERVDFDVYGPEEDAEYVAACRRAAAGMPGGVRVRFLGPISPEDVGHTLSGYDAMLLPTAGENFGHVIAEALSVSCAVFVPDTTPWSALLRAGGGRVLPDREVARWAAVITELARLLPEERLALRAAAGEAYVRWRSADQAAHVFEQVAVRLAQR